TCGDRRAAWFGGRVPAPDRAGRGDPPQVRHPRAGAAQPRTDDRCGAARDPATAAAGTARSTLARNRRAARTGCTRKLPRTDPRTSGFPRLLPRRHPDRRDRTAADRIAPEQTWQQGRRRIAARDPVGVLVGAEPLWPD